MFFSGWRDGADPVLPGRVAWWKSVHGIDLSAMIPMTETYGQEASVEILDPAQICTDRHTLRAFNLNTVLDKDLDFEVPFSLTLATEGPLHGFVADFDVAFTDKCGCVTPVKFDTAAHATPTHWKQTLFILDPERSAPGVVFPANTVVTGRYAMKRDKINPRDYDVALEWAVTGPAGGREGKTDGCEAGKAVYTGKQRYTLSS